jgi:ABC-type Fe3+ transport system permease subunit
MLALLAIAVLAVPAAVVTSLIAMLVKRTRATSTAPLRTFVLVGSVAPFLMIAYGLFLSWPWPWYQPEAMKDGIPPGPLLLTASPVAWPLCLAESYFALVRRQRGQLDRDPH